MKITVHEWPLPVRELDAINVVFELACPIVFDMWRSVTFHILIDICTPGDVSPSHPSTTLQEYAALQHYRECHPKQRLTLASDAKPFTNSHYSRPSIPNASFLVAAHSAEPSLALADFETVIELGIDDWVARVSPQKAKTACTSIEACASAYSSRALIAYEGNPENLSIMLVTLFELWVAMDKVVVGRIPFLAEYSPEIPVTLLGHLLVRKSSALGRVKQLHAYLKARHRGASSGLSVFSSTTNDKSFAVRYFYQSRQLTSLKLNIEKDAEEERKAKKNELQTLNQRYADLQKHAEALRQPQHRLDWPQVPELDAINVVFELACPIVFDMWRSVTFHILVDICSPGEVSPSYPSTTLQEYAALQRYRECHPKQRLTLASDAKSFTNSHYNRPSIPTSEDNVTLNFRREEVHLLLAQAVLQVGPFSSEEELLWHKELNNMPFITALFAELESLMATVEGNWLEGVTISTIIMLVCRALSSTSEESIKSRGYLLLRRIRSATFTLLTELSARMQASSDEAVSREFQGRVRDMALTCRSTFDVDGDASFIQTSDEDMGIFTYCAVMIYDNTPSQPGDLPKHSQRLLERDKRCCLALEASVRRHAEFHKKGLDRAVGELWGSYRQGTPWRALPAPNSRWLVSHTAPSSSQSPQAVHFNLISGCLLVDGRQLGRLPSAIMQHSTYQAIFRDQVLDIVPADIPGMAYATRGNIYGHQVSFALRSGDLIICAKHTNQGSPILQLIPSQTFVGDLPISLIAGHIHWLNLDTSEIEIRPAENAWTSSLDNWRLRFAVTGPSTPHNAGGKDAPSGGLPVHPGHMP
ncbi:hypothetical protein M405DRAFT_885095 [Rhizopogon salebrosus TDB-379]|nr:hypothetical protein M405DRAFT_885095 [Rhizopogon salebrosus TDB-379]